MTSITQPIKTKGQGMCIFSNIFLLIFFFSSPFSVLARFRVSHAFLFLSIDWYKGLYKKKNDLVVISLKSTAFEEQKKKKKKQIQ